MKRTALGVLLVVLFTTLQGCSSETRNDMKNDVNEAANDLNRKVEDAVD